ncbi:hypothetical protein Tco_0055428 [Tanacetum coccineum]
MVVWCSVVMECEGGDVAVDGVASVWLLCRDGGCGGLGDDGGGVGCGNGDGGDKGEGGGCGVVKVAVVWRGGGEGWCSWRSTGDRRKLAGI